MFIFYAIYYQLHSSKLLNTESRYTIGIIDKIEPAGNGLRVHIYFIYKNVKEKRDYIEDIDKVKKMHIGQRVFIRFIPQNNRSFDLNLNCAVPDSLYEAPYDGWNKEGVRKYFSNCLDNF